MPILEDLFVKIKTYLRSVTGVARLADGMDIVEVAI